MNWIGQTGFYPPPSFNMNFAPYCSMSYMSTGTSNSDSSNNFSGKVRDIENKKKKSILNEYCKKKEAENLKVSVNSEEKASLIEHDAKRNRKRKITEQGSLLGTLGMTALFTSGPDRKSVV